MRRDAETAGLNAESRPPLLRIERHPLGARVYVLGLRWHEWQLGALILTLLAFGTAAGRIHPAAASLLAALAAVWLIAKDWRDLSPSRRDTVAWRLGVHCAPLPLRQLRRGEPLPLVAAAAAAALAVVNLLSALTPNIGWRGHLLLRIEPMEELHVFHALAVPASIALFVSAYYLCRRRWRALQLAILLLVALGLFNLLKGLDFEEAIGDFVVAAGLWAGRTTFYVRHEPLTARAAALRAPFVIAAAFLVSLALVLVAAPDTASFATVVRETCDLLLWQRGPLRFDDELARMDVALGLVGIATLMIVAYLLFRPLAAPRDLPDADVRETARELVHAHGSDTLAYFKLRRDKHYLFTGDRCAFLGYRIENRVLMVSGDPVGPPEAIRDLLARLAVFAEQRGLAVAELGVSESLRARFEELGLRAVYIGDEAIVETDSFSLEGRAIRKARQSVSRLQRAGYRVGVAGRRRRRDLRRSRAGLSCLARRPARARLRDGARRAPPRRPGRHARSHRT